MLVDLAKIHVKEKESLLTNLLVQLKRLSNRQKYLRESLSSPSWGKYLISDTPNQIKDLILNKQNMERSSFQKEKSNNKYKIKSLIKLIKQERKALRKNKNFINHIIKKENL